MVWFCQLRILIFSRFMKWGGNQKYESFLGFKINNLPPHPKNYKTPNCGKLLWTVSDFNFPNPIRECSASLVKSLTFILSKILPLIELTVGSWAMVPHISSNLVMHSSSVLVHPLPTFPIPLKSSFPLLPPTVVSSTPCCFAAPYFCFVPQQVFLLCSPLVYFSLPLFIFFNLF